MVNLDLRGKNALITGVSRRAGIGAAIAFALAEAGANVFITYYRPYDAAIHQGSSADDATAILTSLQAKGLHAAGMEADLADPLMPARIFDAAENALGPLHILVNNATHSEQTPIESITAADLDKHYAVNLRGAMLLCAEFVRRFDDDCGGRIINFSSGQGVGPMPGELAYVATKGAIEAITVTLSAEVKGRGITVNAIDPGITDTGWIPDELRQRWPQQMLYNRLGQPADAARLVRFLASTEAEWITGQVIHSRGGF